MAAYSIDGRQWPDDPPIALPAYPWPEGMDIPRLMPYQSEPFNGDPHLAAEVCRLLYEHDLTNAVETGTCLGSTTIWLCDHFDTVTTTEVNAQFSHIAVKRFALCKVNPTWHLSTSDVLLDQLRNIPKNTFCFLDAHWGVHCPLLDELDAIAEGGTKPCIVIHDFQVPGTDFGFDKMPDGRPFSLDLIGPYLDRIYGVGKWDSRYPTQVAGAKRGWVSIELC